MAQHLEKSSLFIEEALVPRIEHTKKNIELVSAGPDINDKARAY